MLWLSIFTVLTAAPNDRLAQAEQQIAQVRYADAEKSLAAAWAQPNNSRETTLKILMLQGITASVLGRPNAREFFRQLLMLDAERKLPEGLPPRVRTPFYEAKGLATESPPMKFTASAVAAPDGARLTAQLSADPLRIARKVRFHSRVGTGAWKDSDVALTGFTASFVAGYGSIAWWAELLGENDGALFAAGSADSPFTLVATDLKPPPPPPGPAPAVAEAQPPAPQPTVHQTAPAPPGRPLAAPVILWASAAVAIGTGIAMGVASANAYAEVNNAARDANGVVTGLTQQRAAELRDTGRTEAAVANVLYVTGGVLAGAGLVVFLVSKPVEVSLAPVPGGAAIAGSF